MWCGGEGGGFLLSEYEKVQTNENTVITSISIVGIRGEKETSIPHVILSIQQ